MTEPAAHISILVSSRFPRQVINVKLLKALQSSLPDLVDAKL